MISASQVKDLREKTGAGMMDCKHVSSINILYLNINYFKIKRLFDSLF